MFYVDCVLAVVWSSVFRVSSKRCLELVCDCGIFGSSLFVCIKMCGRCECSNNSIVLKHVLFNFHKKRRLVNSPGFFVVVFSLLFFFCFCFFAAATLLLYFLLDLIMYENVYVVQNVPNVTTTLLENNNIFHGAKRKKGEP